MTRREFRNAVAILNSIDFGDVPEIGREAWGRFSRDPIKFLSRAPDGIAEAIWAEVLRRMPKRMAAE